MAVLRLSNKHVASHVAVDADTGGGKTLFTEAVAREIERRGDVAVVWDPDKQLTRKFRSIERGDWVIDPTSPECPYWAMQFEHADEGEAHQMSTCFFPDNPNVKDPFWNNSARLITTILNTKHRPAMAELAFWLANEDELDDKLKGTEGERILSKNAAPARASIISHLNLMAQPLRLMPTVPQSHRVFTVRDYCQTRDSWVFITSSPTYASIMNPLHTFFVSSMIQRLVAMGPRPDLPRVWLIFEEASTVVIQEFHMALIRLRKTNTPVLYCIQNLADFKAPYAERTETIYSQPYYKVFFRLSSDESAKKASATVGDKKIERLREQVRRPYFGVGKSERSYYLDEQDVPVIPFYRFQGLKPRHGIIISPGKVSEFILPIIKMPDRLPLMEDRPIPSIYRTEEDEMETEFFGQGVF